MCTDVLTLQFFLLYFGVMSHDKSVVTHREPCISLTFLLLSSLVSAAVYDAQMSPMEAVVLNAMMVESSILNLRAHFLNRLPDLSPLAGMLTHLNLSFNDLWVSCEIVFDVKFP